MNKKPRLTDLCHESVRSTLKKGDCAIDATVGNGHDTLFLSQAVGNTGHIIGFDIQHLSIESTRQRLTESNAQSAITLIEDSHGKMSQYIPIECKTKITAVMFNLGYLPGSDKTVITSKTETLKAIKQALGLIKSGGILSVMAYPGHFGGREETDSVIEYARSLDQKRFKVVIHRSTSSQGPVLLLVTKLFIEPAY